MSEKPIITDVQAETQRLFQPPANGELIQSPRGLYYIGEPIGSGAFGDVYACTDDWRNRLVAKVIKPLNRSYEEVRIQWLDELVKLAQLRHPNVTYVYDAFEYKDTFYLILERCDHSMHDLFALPKLDGNFWLPIVGQSILQAVHFMHGAGYVHKDLHAGNIFLQWVSNSYDNEKSVLKVKVGDLGISRLESDINIFGTILAEWMKPPEAINPAEFGLVGKQVDLYHTGLLLLSLLNGSIPNFSVDEILAGKPRELAESIDSPYRDVVAKALRRHVSSRYQSALEFWRDLRALVPAV